MSAISHKSLKNRTRNDIAAGILKVCMEGALKTKVMFDVYLNYNQVNSYLEHLRKSDMLKYDEFSRRYVTTKKGRFFLKNYNSMESLLPLHQS